MSLAAQGDFVLRIEDIDQTRARPQWETQIYDDLAWLGIRWAQPVMRQSDRLDTYAKALDTLWEQGLLYECRCTRADIAAATSAPQEGAPLLGPDGVIYPGTCRGKHQQTTKRPVDAVLRLNMAQALHQTSQNTSQPNPLSFHEALHPDHRGVVKANGPHMLRNVGDIVLARRDMGTSYHLSVVLDDATQGITDVVRGADLFDATIIHVILQKILGLPTPTYHHHRLIRDENGKRLAKRDDARAISLFRKEGIMPTEIRSITMD
ncbi:glutamyl-Q tRNA(Asp) synthetase [Sulfitobacter undariae]|uniref:Glutamyl-Q tRNA(Asp) synthetase n=2 Tax=Sulfitobacter undariae TaxID=1563671 RepID=A0A7W6H0F8_9RHOB|nr:glutamyl-Q tRNA(Asp) synthetase [Sulfitobacter undariae]